MEIRTLPLDYLGLVAGVFDQGETVPNQLKKQTQRPTFKWIAFLFMSIAEVTIWLNGEMHISIANLNENLVKIIRLLGRDCEKYYALEH